MPADGAEAVRVDLLIAAKTRSGDLVLAVRR